MFMFEKPLGMVDTLPNLFEVKKKTRQAMTNVIEQWGFQFIETPTLEYYETVGVQSAILDQQLFKLLDQQGHTLVLRPDMTAPIARVAASKLYNHLYPLRLAYSANVFRAQHREGGRPAEFEQVGVELIGDGTTSADAEVIALMVATLKDAGLENFKIAIGHIEYANALFKEVLGNQERADVLRRYLYEKNYVGYKEHVKSLPLSSIDQERLFTLLTLRGGIDKVEAAKAIVSSKEARNSLEEISQLWSTLEAFQVTDYLKLDLNIVSHMSYYTGVLFEVYADNVGFVLGNGGRYDHLFEKFNHAAPATGFGIRLDRLIEALKMSDEQQLQCVIFSQERREEAIARTAELRANHKRVVMQDITGIKDVDSYTKHFVEVDYIIGSRKEEL
ncbi:ATP phosphoribosyltransferase regulatory subunit [Metabacillus sediminilitoris]|uniref:ATP phosphoribosyltransferase regulatory subunit n=1 Tax=Metabacillus sediminilitoris TaxID=2567941 RepID=A0A4S4C1Q7_9BACI|nr:ATP phosphoribosyltransferase regulatory subunit [Metabacillus sediminilitoris]QGQ48057.1 ATP phosphoribosyltransferase regulatory subunit [Metabacillus sediminilitoris]THF81581.1 ATP phosphoribosyltransferase regulatory subunit [Metabacillus sediminilitoris]